MIYFSMSHTGWKVMWTRFETFLWGLFSEEIWVHRIVFLLCWDGQRDPAKSVPGCIGVKTGQHTIVSLNLYFTDTEARSAHLDRMRKLYFFWSKCEEILLSVTRMDILGCVIWTWSYKRLTGPLTEFCVRVKRWPPELWSSHYPLFSRIFEGGLLCYSDRSKQNKVCAWKTVSSLQVPLWDRHEAKDVSHWRLSATCK